MTDQVIPNDPYITAQRAAGNQTINAYRDERTGQIYYGNAPMQRASILAPPQAVAPPMTTMPIGGARPPGATDKSILDPGLVNNYIDYADQAQLEKDQRLGGSVSDGPQNSYGNKDANGNPIPGYANFDDWWKDMVSGDKSLVHGIKSIAGDMSLPNLAIRGATDAGLISPQTAATAGRLMPGPEGDYNFSGDTSNSHNSNDLGGRLSDGIVNANNGTGGFEDNMQSAPGQSYDQHGAEPPNTELDLTYNPGDYSGDAMSEYAKYDQAYMADGGPVRQMPMDPMPMGDPSRADNLQRNLSEGEFVIPADVAKHFGTKHFDRMIEMARKPKGIMSKPQMGMADGGPVEVPQIPPPKPSILSQPQIPPPKPNLPISLSPDEKVSRAANGYITSFKDPNANINDHNASVDELLNAVREARPGQDANKLALYFVEQEMRRQGIKNGLINANENRQQIWQPKYESKLTEGRINMPAPKGDVVKPSLLNQQTPGKYNI
jgi:hypothetical protein